jgi:hypothetical protein
MIDSHLIEEMMLEVPDDWQDTEAQRQLRACLIQILTGHDEVTTMIIANELVSAMRDNLMGCAATVRRSAARAARDDLGMSPAELAKATKQTKQTIARLLTESRSS